MAHILLIRIKSSSTGVGMVPGMRKYERDRVSLIISYSVLAHNPEKAFTALMEDYSYSGLCMVTPHFIEDGQEIIVKSGLSEESVRAVVRWTKGNGDACYKVGAEFRK
jgi:hypothetical protein